MLVSSSEAVELRALGTAVQQSRVFVVPAEPPTPVLFDLRAALQELHLSACLVFREGQPRLLVEQLRLTIAVSGDAYVWGPESRPTWLKPDIAPLEETEAAASVVSDSVNAVLTRQAREHAVVRIADLLNEEEEAAALVQRDPLPSRSRRLLQPHPELVYAAPALGGGGRAPTLHLFHLLPGIATRRELAADAYQAARVLARNLDQRHRTDSTALPVSPWVAAIWVSPTITALTDGTFYLWLSPPGHGTGSKLYCRSTLQGTERLLSRMMWRL